MFDDTAVGEVEVEMDPADLAWLLDPENIWSNAYLPVRVHFRNRVLDQEFTGAGIRLRGNYTRTLEKKSFKLDLAEFEPDGEAELCGLERLNLNGEPVDPCILREKLFLDALGEAGFPVARASHVRLTLNGEYRGLYVHVEEVDSRFLRARFGSAAGNLYKCAWVRDGLQADLAYRPAGDYEALGEGEKRVYELLTDRQASSFQDLAELIDVINNTPAADLPGELEQRLDVAGFLRVMAFDVLTGNWDNYWSFGNNYYLYNDPVAGRFRFIPRDFDYTLGLAPRSLPADYGVVDLYGFAPLDGRAPLLERLFEHDRYRNLFTHFVEEHLEGPLDPNRLAARMEALRPIIRPAAIEDTYRTRDFPFIGHDAFDRGFEEALGGHVHYGLRPFIQTRAGSAPGQVVWRAAPPALWGFAFRPAPPAFPLPGEAIGCVVEVMDEGAVGTVDLFVDGGAAFDAIRMHDDGAHGDGAAGDGVYGARVPGGAAGALVRAYAEARDGGGSPAWSPAGAPAAVHAIQVLEDGPLILNELMARNQATVADEWGEYDDWVELWNRGPVAVNMGSAHLSDDPGEPLKWALPDVTLAPQAHLLLWLDGDEGQGALHAPFRLDGDGEWVGLFRVEGGEARVVDAVSFGPQAPDTAFGRVEDGDREWGRVVPTPGAANQPLGVPPGDPAPDPDPAPPGLALLGSWPNPVREEARVRFASPAAARVRLEVVDVGGRVRVRLLDRLLDSGDHEVPWDGLDRTGARVPAGVYFLRLTVGNDVRAKRFAIVR